MNDFFIRGDIGEDQYLLFEMLNSFSQVLLVLDRNHDSLVNSFELGIDAKDDEYWQGEFTKPNHIT